MYREELPLRKLNEAIDRFCARHPRWGVPGLMRYIIGANIALYLLDLFSHGGLRFLAMDTSAVLHGEVWRLITYVLFPTSGGFWLVISCMFYYWLGASLENIWGSAKFTFYYLSGTLLTSLAMVAAALISGGTYYAAGADYVNLAMFFAYAMYTPDAMVRIYFVLPVKMKWLAWVDGAFFAFGVVQALLSRNWGGVIVPIMALMNFFVFFAPAFRRKVETVTAHSRPQAVQFRKAVKEQQKQRGYNHKCCVCGKTDADYPNMQFRYCSKCQGYHCFCEEHIFNHVHYTE